MSWPIDPADTELDMIAVMDEPFDVARAARGFGKSRRTAALA